MVGLPPSMIWMLRLPRLPAQKLTSACSFEMKWMLPGSVSRFRTGGAGGLARMSVMPSPPACSRERRD